MYSLRLPQASCPLQSRSTYTPRHPIGAGPFIHRRAIKPAAALPAFELADVAPQVAAAGSNVAQQANQALPGSVSAPAWVIPVAVVVVTVGSILSGYLLQPGTEAAEKVFKRDAKRLGNQARAKATKKR